MIDVTAPPYNCRFDWTGSDATATDNYPGLQAAANDAAAIRGPGIDLGGSAGDVLQLPRGAGMVSQKLVLPFGVSMRGQGVSYYSTVLKMKDTFDPNSHFIDIGDATTHIAAMGCGVSDMILYSRNDVQAAPYRSMIYTNNAQDTDAIVSRCRIYAGGRAALIGEIGYGGATMVNFRNITCHNAGNQYAPNPTPIIWLKYSGSTTVDLDGVQVACPAGGYAGNDTYGLYLVGGNFDIRRYHAEQVFIGCCVDLAFDAASMVQFQNCNGNGTVARFIQINNRPSQQGRIRAKNIVRNGSPYTVLNGLPGGAHSTSDIVGEMVF